MVDLIELTSLLQLIFILTILFNFFSKLSYLNEEVNCTDPSPSSKCSMLYVFMTGSVVTLIDYFDIPTFGENFQLQISITR